VGAVLEEQQPEGATLAALTRPLPVVWQEHARAHLPGNATSESTSS
jgi:hypothetical protein